MAGTQGTHHQEPHPLYRLKADIDGADNGKAYGAGRSF
ncbi:hypothetical protein E2C01_089780 [Portunus trituberculatus]|uniref:Uncharacterized protein n=1 Tax=Portunus trituberculatus TaxID=210409 RepID=A0A5B7JJQ4_PORTR|nr:hypothetical protein [Portunus trituberculatus]